jgi:hypothetical protein
VDFPAKGSADTYENHDAPGEHNRGQEITRTDLANQDGSWELEGDKGREEGEQYNGLEID